MRNHTMKKVDLHFIMEVVLRVIDLPKFKGIRGKKSFADFALLLEDEEEDDGMDEIDLDNIVAGRTRGKNINWAEADQKAKEAGDDLDDEDDEDDEDFEDQDSGDKDAMEE